MANMFGCLGLGVALLQLLLTCVSQSTADTCDQCSRSPSSCRRISGLYTVTVLTVGTYNPVVEIPSPACGINITEFSASSNYIAVRTGSGQGIINSYWALGQAGQYYGGGARFSYDRGSGSCKGTCIYSEGPTTETIVIQILYYDKNPGIAYEFTLPNNIPFTPFDGTLSKQDSSTSSSVPAIRYQQPHHSTHRRRHRHDRSHRRENTKDEFEGEYYTGSQYSRSEGRPDTTSALGAHIGVKHSSKTDPLDYTGATYGSHTLGGRGLSYTQAADSHSSRRGYRDRTRGRHIVERYRSRRPHTVQKVNSPQYVSQTDRSRHSSESRNSRYQSFSARTSYLNEDKALGEQFEGSNYLRTYGGDGVSVRRGQNSGNNQYRWKISGFTECSQTCGGGVQKTNIVCISVSDRTQVVVTAENCVNHLKPRAQTLDCNTSPCEPAWEAEEWSECSATCGSGTQTRTVECRQRFSKTLTLRVSADQCGQSDKPAVAQQCEKGLCTSWKAGPWSTCSKECGGGERHRSVQCVDNFESQIPASYCSGPAPEKRERCNTQSCNAHWWLTDWSAECSETCGEGLRSRGAVCMTANGEITDGLCDKRDLPDLQETCRGNTGCRGIWFAGPWEKCSAECGEGTRKREVACLQRSVSSLAITRDEDCDVSLKPVSEESCVNTKCRALWYTSPWSECSVTCSEGHRTREVRCVEDNQHASLRCIDSIKPKTREVCTLSPCSTRPQQSGYSRNEYNTAYDSFNNEDISLHPEDNPAIISNEEDNENEINIDEDEERKEKDSTITTKVETTAHDEKCQDTYWNCLMVTQARLCLYPYYRSRCCQSCKNV